MQAIDTVPVGQEPVVPPSKAALEAPSSGFGSGFLNVFKQMQYKAFQLEADILRTVCSSSLTIASLNCQPGGRCFC